jgi:hypothetical protein
VLRISIWRALRRLNQIWAMDITCISMAKVFVYLAVVLDWFSRRVLAWRLSITMDAAFCIEALQEALARHGKPEIVNTDQGSQSPARPSRACWQPAASTRSRPACRVARRRGRLLGARAPRLLRRGKGERIADCARSARKDRRTVRHRAADRRRACRAAANVRQRLAKPRLDELATWLDAQLQRIPGKSDLAGAIRYARSR